MLINPKTTYRRENENGDLEIRKSFSVQPKNIEIRSVTKESDDGDEVEVTEIDVPVSSTGSDRDGDKIADQGIEEMIQQYQSGTVGIWLDHGMPQDGSADPFTGMGMYPVLDSIGGWVDAYQEGEILRAIGHLEPENQLAEALEDKLQKGVSPVGFSIGFIVLDADERPDADEGFLFRSIDLIETSAVGIPSNPDAIVSDSAVSMAKSIANVTDYDGDTDTLARDLTLELRRSFGIEDPAATETNEKNMQGKNNEEVDQLIELYQLLNDYLNLEDSAGEEPLSEALDWAEDRDSVDDETIEFARDLSEDLELDDAEDPTVSDLLNHVTSLLAPDPRDPDEETEESDDDGEGDGDSDEDDDEEEDGVTREEFEALESELNEVRSSFEEFKESLPEEIEERASKAVNDRINRSGKPTPGGKIQTFEGSEETESKDSNEEPEGKGNPPANGPKPSPAA